MALIIRVQTSQGTHRVTFQSKTATFSELQTAIESKYGIPAETQVLSRTRPNAPDFIENVSPNTPLVDIGLTHGTMIYLIMVKNQIESYKEANSKQQQQQAIASDNSEQKYESQSNTGFKLKAVTKHKSKVRSKRLSDLKNDADDVVDAGPKHVPFHEYIEERQRKFAKTQPWNIDPPQYDYKPVAMGNQVNFSDLPPNAVVIRQKYRHVDVATFYDKAPYEKFKSQWERNNSIQKAAYLIGKYEMIPNNLEKKKKVTRSTKIVSKDSKLMCAKIYCLYEPPQKGTGRGVKLLKDQNSDLVDSVISACGMQRIGIIYTTLPRGGKKYNGDIFMSGNEIFTSARLQEKYKNKNTGFSKFVSLICHIGTKEAQCFMISDQGVAMIKNGLVSAGSTSLTDDAKDNYGFMKVNVPPPKIYLPGVVNENKEIKQGEHFPPDAVLVNIIATAAQKQEHVFNYVHFPSPQNATIDHIRQHLAHHKDKELHIALSDFNLLIYLTKVIDAQLAMKIAQHVVSKQRMDKELLKKVKKELRLNVP
eukprot:87813_1